MPPKSEIILGLRDMTGPGLAKASKSMKAFGQSLNRVGKRMSLFVTGPLVAMGAVALKNAAQFEKQTVAFEVLLGSAEKAQVLLKDIEKFAATTPFQMPGLIDGAQRLLAFGIEAEKVVDTMRSLGDLAMGDQQKLDRLTDAFGKVASRGKASMRELNMFIYSGVPVVQQLADQFDVTTEELFKMSEQGLVTFEAVQKAVSSMTGEGGQFYRMTEKQSKTLAGLFSTLKDNIGMLGREIMEVIMPALKNFIDKAITFVQKLRNMDDDTKKLILKMVAIAAAIGPVIMAIAALATALGVIISPIGLVVLAIGALGTIAILVLKNWEKVSGFLKDLWLDIADFANRIFQHIKVAVMTPIREVLEFVLKIAETTKKVFKGINLEGIESALAGVNDKIDESRNTLEALREQGYRTTDDFKAFGENVASLAKKVGALAVKLKDVIVDGFNMGDMVGGVADEMKGMADALNAADDSLRQHEEGIGRMGRAYYGLSGAVQIGTSSLASAAEAYEKAKADAAEYESYIMSITNKTLPIWSNAWTKIGDSTAKVLDSLKEAMKDTFAALLEMLGKEMLVRAMKALIPAIGVFNPAAAAPAFAASAAAFAAAGFIRSLAQGGQFTTSGPEMVMVGDNPSGRERVTVEPLGGAEEPSERVIENVISIDGQSFFKALTRATKSGEFIVHRKAVVG